MSNISDAALPLVSVIMPAYNAADTIEASVRSILSQSFRDFRLWIMDDGSTDSTAAICRRMAAEDPRVVYHPSEHIGFCGVLNLGLQLSRGRYIARLDSDDLAHPSRLEEQVRFLESHPSVKVLGTLGARVNDNGKRLTALGDGCHSLSEYEEHRRQRKLFYLIHSSVMAHRETVLEFGGYQIADFPAEDTALWTRIAQKHPVLTLPGEYVSYRISAGGISSRQQWLMILQFHRQVHNLRTGEALSLNQFAARVGLLRKLRMKWGCWHKSAMRFGAYHYFNGRRGLGGMYLLLAMLLEPFSAAKRVLRWT